jgi:hypothetical protein
MKNGDQLATVFSTWPRFSQPAQNCIGEGEFTGCNTQMRYLDNATVRPTANSRSELNTRFPIRDLFQTVW